MINVLTYTFEPSVTDREEWTVGAALRRQAALRPDAVYLDAADSGETWTYAETQEVATRIASGLLAAGHAPGDRLVILMPNNAEYILAWLGSSLAGLAQVPINTAYRGTFFEHQVRTVAPTGAVVTPELADRLIESRDACQTIRHVHVVSPDEKASAEAIDRLTRVGYVCHRFADLMGAETAELPVVRPEDLGAVFFTSGTTGLSKGVAMSHSQLHFFAEEGAALVQLTPADVYMSVGPLFHGNAQFLTAYPSLICGARYVLRERFSASRWTSWLRDSGVTVTNLVGVMSDFLWKQPPRADDAEHRLRCVWAVPNPPSADAFRRRFGVDVLVENFGQTEISMPILTPYGEPRPSGAAGLLVDEWFEARLVDPGSGDDVAVGEVGELVVRAKHPGILCDGYFAMPERTAEVMRNGWFSTGDGLRRDADGWYFFADRLKDAIRRRGENISSFEVEQAILSSPEVVECAVIGVPAGGANEDEVMAHVVRRPHSALDVRALWAHCEESMPAFAVPRFVRFVDELPKTASGKVRKVELRAEGVNRAHDRENSGGRS